MVLTPSTRAGLGARAPDFTLPDARGNPVALAEFAGAPVDTVLAGQTPAGEQKPGLGCNVKWKPGNEPDYCS